MAMAEPWSHRFLGSQHSATYYGAAATLKPLNGSNVGTLRAYLQEQESNYSDGHYSRVVESEGYSLIAMKAGRPIGCVCCSLDDDEVSAAASPFSPMQTMWRLSQGKSGVPETKVVKVMLLQVSPADRGGGIGSNMLRYVIRAAKGDSRVSRLILDVHADNEGAIRLYRRFGFRITHSKQNFSKSWVMELPIGEDLFDDETGVSQPAPKPSSTTTTTTTTTDATTKWKGRTADGRKTDGPSTEETAETWRRRIVDDPAMEKWENRMEQEKGRGGRVGGEGGEGGRGAASEEKKGRRGSGEERLRAIEEKKNGETLDCKTGTDNLSLAERVKQRRRIRQQKAEGAVDEAETENRKTLENILDGWRSGRRKETSAAAEEATVGIRNRKAETAKAAEAKGAEATMARLRTKASELNESGRKNLTTKQNHRWTVYSVSNWRSA